MEKSATPLILRFHRLMEAFAKSDDERDFYLDTQEGFILFLDIDKNLEDVDRAQAEIAQSGQRFILIPKMTFYEIKKFMEGFIHEKVYDIDTKEKLLDIIQSKEARENFLEFIYDHLSELEKWQQYYHERSRVRIIEWLRQHYIHFAFEEDLDIALPLLTKVKKHFFDNKAPKDVMAARSTISSKAKTYYSNEALNPRPKRGRPPKQIVKIETEPQFTADMFTTASTTLRPFIFSPEFSTSGIIFSTKSEAQFLANLRGGNRMKIDEKLELLSKKLQSFRHLSTQRKNKEELTTTGVVEIEPFSKNTEKITSVIQGVLPKKRGRPRKNPSSPKAKKGRPTKETDLS